MSLSPIIYGMVSMRTIDMTYAQSQQLIQKPSFLTSSLLIEELKNFDEHQINSAFGEYVFF
jgi:hypothetical protein